MVVTGGGGDGEGGEGRCCDNKGEVSGQDGGEVGVGRSWLVSNLANSIMAPETPSGGAPGLSELSLERS